MADKAKRNRTRREHGVPREKRARARLRRRPGSGFARTTGARAAVLGFAAWGFVVWIWPGLDLGNDAASRGLQPAVLIAAASIQAAVVLFGLTIGAVVLQVMGKYSWTVIRNALPKWLLPVMAVAMSGGVVLPLWVSFSPTPRLSTAAFAGFGWSFLLIGASAWETARRMNPQAVSAHARRRALAELARDLPPAAAVCAETAEVLGQLAADVELPYYEGLMLVATYAMVLAHRARTVPAGETAAAIRAFGERAASAESTALASGVARAMWVLGLDQLANPVVCREALGCLTAIALDARSRGQREVAGIALDALASITAARVSCGLDQIGYRTPPWQRTPPPERLASGGFPQPRYPSSLPLDEAPEPAAAPLAEAERRGELDRFVGDFAAEDGAVPESLVSTLRAGLLRPTDVEQLAAPPGDDSSTRLDDYDLLCETVETLTSLLPAPQPSSTAWPTGWQGHGALDRDVRRLTAVAESLYRQGKRVPSDLVEAALELIGVRLRAEPLTATDLPAARTDWRYPPSRSEEGGIASTTANSLGSLMRSAFDAGFDRRALNTGLRLLASATASAQHGDLDATRAYTFALDRFTVDTSRHGLEAHSEAGAHRMEVVLTCLIAECDQLLLAAQQQRGSNREIYEAVQNTALYLAWNMPHAHNLATVVAMLQARLAVAGWPVDLPSGQRRMHLTDEPVTPPAPQPLSGDVLAEAETLFKDWLSHQDLRPAMAALTTLWAHAACAACNGSRDEAQRVAQFLADRVNEHDQRYAEMPTPLAAPGEEQAPGYQDIDPHLRRVISAAVRWCTKADPTTTPTIPHAPGPRTAHSIARWLAVQPGTEDWTYRGAEDVAETKLVTVQMQDGSRRVLRDREVRTGDLTWGYGGTGPHDFATALVQDLLGDYYKCPDCLGTIKLAANSVTCGACANTGVRNGVWRAERAALTKIIVGLPGEFERTRIALLRSLVDV